MINRNCQSSVRLPARSCCQTTPSPDDVHHIPDIQRSHTTPSLWQPAGTTLGSNSRGYASADDWSCLHLCSDSRQLPMTVLVDTWSQVVEIVDSELGWTLYGLDWLRSKEHMDWLQVHTSKHCRWLSTTQTSICRNQRFNCRVTFMLLILCLHQQLWVHQI